MIKFFNRPSHKAPAPKPADRITVDIDGLRVGDWYYVGGQGAGWVKVLAIEELSASEKRKYAHAGFTHRTFERYSERFDPHWNYASRRVVFTIWPR